MNDLIIENTILDADSYKYSQPWQYPPGTRGLFGFIAPRGGHYEETVANGLQPLIQRQVMPRVTMAMVEEAKIFAQLHGEPFPYEGWKYIVERHGGAIPLRIMAAPEGSVIPTGNIHVTMENTDPQANFVYDWFETRMVRYWYPVTVSSRSYYIKNLILSYLNQTSDDPEGSINFMLHDFGSRGASSQESACIGGAAHLINFMGSDTTAGIWYANKYYGIEMAGFSIPASQHSTITSWGRENEKEACLNMIKQFGAPGKIVACVSDSYNIYNCTKNIWCAKDVQEAIINSGCKLVIRPDSGNPATVVLRVLNILKDELGMEKNSKSYFILPKHMGVIQGDGIDESSIQDILATMKANMFAASNIAFGMGGALLQRLDRDTQSFAMKCSARQTMDGIWHDVYKDPVDDPGKTSIKGRLSLITNDNFEYQTIRESDPIPTGWRSALQLVYENGQMFNKTTFAEIRARTEMHRQHKLKNSWQL